MRDFLSITRALSDEARVRALLAVKDGELCLCQIIHLLQLAPSTVSKHMSLLVQAGLLECRKEGRWRFYTTPGANAPAAVKQALRWVASALSHEPVISGDAQNIRKSRKKSLEEFSACYRS